MVDDAVSRRVHQWLAPFGGVVEPVEATRSGGCPVTDWAASGVLALTGDPDRPPTVSSARMWPLVAGVAARIESLAARVGVGAQVDPAVVLGGRAALLGLVRGGQISPGGTSRLLRCEDGWCAITLSRPDDLDLVPAILGRPQVGDPWSELASLARQRPRTRFADDIQQFGVPAAPLPTHVPEEVLPWRLSRFAEAVPGTRLDGALVVDLSSLWAGPLCARTLCAAGAKVVKVESTRRPDGARSGNAAFYDWLHAGHASVALDFTAASGRRKLAKLIAAADVVIEGSRPRALRQLGVGPEQVDHRAGTVWVSITGYGRRNPDLVAFGDDAAVAGGLVGWEGTRPVFCADAVADPLTGMCAALGVLASIAEGGGHLIDISMRDVSAAFAGAPAAQHGLHDVRRAGSDWVVWCPADGSQQRVVPPKAPVPTGRAPALGVDTERVLSAVASGQRW